MKRCPNCNQTFEEDWLSFCTRDGTTLIEDSSLSSDPPPTILSPSPVEASAQNQQAAWDFPSAPQSLPQWAPPQPMASAWQPPPPPAYAQPQNKSLATAAMVVGIL